MTKMPVRGWLTLTAALTAAACSPPTLPEGDSSVDSSAADSMSQPDAPADRTVPPDVMSRPDSMPDSAPDAVAEAGPDAAPEAAVEAGADAAEAGSDAAAEAGMDAMADGSTGDASGMDGASEGGSDAAVTGCGLPVVSAIAIPAAGMTTTVMGTMPAAGMGGSIGSLGCVSTTGGAEQIYRLTITSRIGVQLAATASLSTTDLTMALRRNCASTPDIACNDDTTGLNPAVRAILDPGEYFVVVDEYGAAADATGGAFSLALTTFAVATNSECSMPETLTGMTLMGNTAGGAVPATTCNSFNNGPQLFYSYTIPANTRTTFTATPTGTPAWAPYVRIVSDCASAATCLATQSGTSGMPTNAVFENRTAMARTVTVSVGSTTTANGGAFTISASNLTLPTAAPNADCSTPVSLTGVTVMGDTNTGGAPATTCNSTNNGPQLFYSLTIPANSLATITATPTGAPAWAPYLRLVADCASAGTCLATQSGTAGSPTTLLFENRMAMARTIVVSVGSTTTTNGGAFTLTGTTMMLPPVPANATCASAEMLSLPATGVMGTTLGATERRSSFSCATLASGGQLVYYTATVPAGRTMQFRVNPASPTFNPAIQAFLTCMPTTCEDFVNERGAGEPEQINYFNPDATDQTVIFAVGSRTDRDQASFTVDASLLPAAASNTTCAMARPLTAGRTNNQLQTTATGTSTATCQTFSTGAPLYYSVTVPANQRATLTALTYSGNADPVLRIRPDCATNACVASANSGFAGDNETVSWTNATGAPVTYIVELASDDSTYRGVFDLDLSFSDASPGYTLVPLPSASCDDLSMGATNVTFGSTDDSASSITALPSGFTFPYFSDSMNVISHYSVTTNGFAQLWTSSAGSPSTSATQGENALPSTLNPTGLLAAFWDDLIVASPSVVRTMVTGTAPNRRLVIEWNNATIYLRAMQDQLRFQIKLSEGSGIVEYHYCSMTSTDAMSTRHFGSSALIGLQNITRSRGQTYLMDGTDTGMMGGMPRSIGGGTAASPSLLRFIPTGM